MASLSVPNSARLDLNTENCPLIRRYFYWHGIIRFLDSMGTARTRKGEGLRRKPSDDLYLAPV
jgi:hypothetical protein